MKKRTKRSRKVEEIMYSKFRANQATMYGTNIEETARQQYVTYRQQYVTYQHQKGHPGLGTHRVGLVISGDMINLGCMAASPGDKVQYPNADQPLGVVEYKNPFTMYCCS